ncbi:MAG: HEAT repeat domain-containing protein [Verrucomicrobiaceae bacterium]|nr:HEAT repeat domain-containing protein [Verrucomicrobiaceae bacterium]
MNISLLYHFVLIFCFITLCKAALVFPEARPPPPFRTIPVSGIKGIIAALEDPAPEVRAYGVSFLAEADVRSFQDLSGNLAAKVAAKVITLLKDSNVLVRVSAVKVMGKLGSAAAPHLSEIIALLKDPDNYVRSLAAAALGNLGEVAAPRVSEIAALLKDPDSDVKRSAAAALGEFGAAAAPYVSEIAALLKDPDSNVKSSAAAALSKLGAEAAPQVSEIAALLKDPDIWVKSSAAEALCNLGAAAAPYVSEIIALLKDPDSLELDIEIISIAQGLGKLGAVAAPHVSEIAALLKDPHSYVKRSAAAALGNLGAVAAPHASEIRALLKDPDLSVKASAAEALVNLGAMDAPHTSEIRALLKDPDVLVRIPAVKALGKLGAVAAPHVSEIAALLKDPDRDVKRSAAAALGEFGAAAAPYVSEIAALLKDPDSYVKRSAASALGEFGAMAAPHVSEIAALLKDPDSDVKSSAAAALGEFGAMAAPHVSEIIALLKDPDPDPGSLGFSGMDFHAKSSAAAALDKLGQVALPHVSEIIALLKYPSDDGRRSAAKALANLGAAIAQSREADSGTWHWLTPLPFLEAGVLYPSDAAEHTWLAYYLTGADADAAWVSRHLSSRLHLAKPSAAITEGKEWMLALQRLTKVIHDGHNDAPHTTESAGGLAATIAREGQPGKDQLSVLRELSAVLGEAQQTNARLGSHTSVVDGVIRRIEAQDTLRQALRKAAWIVGLHLLLWALILIAYPHSSWVQAQIFWNPWVRKLAGAGYVPALVSAVPFLRRRLFAPFRDSLVRRGEVDAFDAVAFYQLQRVRQVQVGKRRAATETVRAVELLGALRGPAVLQAASGLGKSTLLRSLAVSSSHTVALLRATECDKGIIAALQGRLQGSVGDPEFLRTLLHAGAVDILVDGLNEAPPDTRARIMLDTEQNFRGNILLATQPLPGRLPDTAQVWELRELEPGEIHAFLMKQGEALVPAATDGKPQEDWLKDYQKRTEMFLADLDERAKTDLAAQEERRQLCNPLEASIAADILARGDCPAMHKILEQQAELMECEFEGHYNRPFNHGLVAEETLKWRQSGSTWVEVGPFFEEADAMRTNRLMLSRADQGADGKAVERWRYRHDKLMFHFLYPAFVSAKGRGRRFELAADDRFHGAYDLLAMRLSMDEAEDVERHLINLAAETGDNRLSNRFTLLLQRRRLISGSAPTASTPPLPKPAKPMPESLICLTAKPETCKCDVVFVHGLMGNLRDTWTHPTGGCWPEWVAQDFPEAAVWSLGYNATLSAWQEESMPLSDRGSSLVDQLCNEGLGTDRPLIFITHSMGGLAVKQLLRHAESFGVKRWESLARNTVGVAFISTPHSGANLASFATFVSAVLRTNPQLHDMEKHSSRLRELHAWFLAWVARQNPVCRAWVERQAVKPKVFGVELPAGLIVVDATSGEPNIPGEVAVPLDEDHISIVKLASRDAQLYKGIRGLIREALKPMRES